jgi:hypothetical protein
MFPHTKPLAGTQINPLHPLSNGLVGCWLFNEGAGSLANDISGYKNHGRLTNMSQNAQDSGWGGSKFGGGLGLDGVDDYIDCGSTGNVNSDNFTLCARIYINSFYTSGTGDTPIIFYKGEYNVNGYYMQLDYSANPNDGGFKIHTNQLDATQVTYSDTGILTPGHWVDLVAVKTGTHIVLFKDGFDVTNTHGIHINPAESSDNFQISKYADSTIAYFLDGSIDNVRIYNRALSAEEIAWLYREPYTMFEPAFNPALLYSAAPPVGAIMNQFQRANIGADLYNGVFA